MKGTLGLLLLAMIFSFPFKSPGQSYLKAEVVNTNCPVSHNYADTWYFGQNAGIDFVGGPAVPLTNMFSYNLPQCNALISDSTGRLLFYTDGKSVWDRSKNLMPNGTGLAGNPGVTQPAIIIPNPEDDDIYYIFTVDIIRFTSGDTTKNGFRYSEVDLSLNDGYGDVTEDKNVELLTEVTSKVTAVQHDNGTDFWVLAHKWNSNEFCAYHVSGNGVNKNYVSSKLGVNHQGDIFENNFIGNMKFSHDGAKLALAVNGMGVFEIMDFNSSTGKLNNVITSAPGYYDAYGVEFSPNTRYLYGTTAFVGSGSDSVSRLWQFDIASGSGIFNNPYLVATDSTGLRFCSLQVGADGRIYIARASNYFGSGQLSVIYNPDRAGIECNIDLLDGSPSYFNLGGKNSSWGMPVFAQSYFDLPHFDVQDICHLDQTMFTLRNNANMGSVSWDFGDPSSSSNTSSSLQPFHEFTVPGEYNVQVTETSPGGVTFTYTERVIVNELPDINLGDTIYMFAGSNVVLDAAPDMQNYLWNTGQETQAITVNHPGTYWVEAEDYKCCFNTDSVEVILFDVMVPNAFVPGGVNDVFKAVATEGVELQKFEMLIFNRWGEAIFQSNNIDDGWYGLHKGEASPSGVYVWLINYVVERDGGEEMVTYKGNVVLIR